mgnify:CR=1 FL=1
MQCFSLKMNVLIRSFNVFVLELREALIYHYPLDLLLYFLVHKKPYHEQGPSVLMVPSFWRLSLQELRRIPTLRTWLPDFCPGLSVKRVSVNFYFAVLHHQLVLINQSFTQNTYRGGVFNYPPPTLAATAFIFCLRLLRASAFSSSSPRS